MTLSSRLDSNVHDQYFKRFIVQDLSDWPNKIKPDPHPKLRFLSKNVAKGGVNFCCILTTFRRKKYSIYSEIYFVCLLNDICLIEAVLNWVKFIFPTPTHLTSSHYRDWPSWNMFPHSMKIYRKKYNYTWYTFPTSEDFGITRKLIFFSQRM